MIVIIASMDDATSAAIGPPVVIGMGKIVVLVKAIVTDIILSIRRLYHQHHL